MNYKLILIKERYDFLKQEMSDKVFFVKNEIEGDLHWVHFEIQIDGRMDILDLFHTAMMYGIVSQGAELHSN